MEWTHDVRPLQAVAPQPVFAQQPVYTAPAPASPAAFSAPSHSPAHAAPVAETALPEPAAHRAPSQPAHAAQPVFPAPSAQPEFPAPTAQPVFPAPTAQPAVPAQPAFPAPTAQPAFPAPTAQPAFPAPTAQPAFPAPTAQPAFPAPTAQPAFPAPTAQPEYAAQPTYAPQAAPVAPVAAPVTAAAPAAAPSSPFSQFQGQPVIAKPLSMADVPGGGINPFAVIDAQEAASAYDPYGFAPPAAPSTGYASPSPFGTPPAAAAQAPAGSWYNESPRGMGPEPTNGVATVGLVLSLVGLNVFGIIFSIIGLRKARGFEAGGDLPVGRKRSRWGLGLGIASLIICVGLIVAYFFAAQYFIALYQQQFGTSIVTTDDSDGFTIDSDEPTVIDLSQGGAVNGGISDDSYDRAVYEQGILDEYALEGDPTPDSVTCPDTGSLNEGGVITCEIITGTTTETRTAEYFGNGEYSISTMSMTAP